MPAFYDPSLQPGLYNARTLPRHVGDECDSLSSRIQAGLPGWWLWTPFPKPGEIEDLMLDGEDGALDADACCHQ